MIKTTITVSSTNGNRTSTEEVIVQSAGDISIDEDVSSHRNGISLDNIEHAIDVTIESIQEEIKDEEEAKAKALEAVQALPTPSQDEMEKGKEVAE